MVCVAGQLHDGVDEDGGQARNGDAAGDHTGHGAGHSHGDGALSAGCQSIDGGEKAGLHSQPQDLSKALAFHLADIGGQQVDKADDKGGQDGDGSRGCHGLCTGGHQPYQQHQGQYQIEISEQIAPLRQLCAGNALQTQLLCFQMHGDEDAGKVQNSGQNSLYGDLSVGHDPCIPP